MLNDYFMAYIVLPNLIDNIKAYIRNGVNRILKVL